MAWVDVNTWVVLDLVSALLGKFDMEGGLGLQYVVAAVIMVVQLLPAPFTGSTPTARSRSGPCRPPLWWWR